MKRYIKPETRCIRLKENLLFINNVSGDDSWHAKRNKKIIEDAEYLSEDVSFEKEGIDSEL